MTTKIKDIDTSTGKEIVRTATADELAALEIANAESEAMKAETLAKQEAKAAALVKLGITADELAALL